MKRRAMAGFAAAVMVISLFGVQSEVKASAEGDKEVTLDVWCWDDSFNGYAMKKAAELYMEDHPQVSVNVDTTTSDMVLQFTSAVTTGQYDLLPDIILVQDTDLKKNQALYQAYADLTDSGIDFEHFAAYKTEAATGDDGRIYGVPFDNGVGCYVFRNDLLEEAGFKAVDLKDITWDEFIEIGEKVKEKLDIPMTLVRTDAGFTLMEMMMQGAGSWYFDDSGDISVSENKDYRAILDKYLEMVQKGIVVEVSDGEQYSSAFYDGSVLGTVNASWILATVKQGEELAGKWRISNIPKMEGIEGATNSSSSGGCSWAVIGTSENKDAAVDLLKETMGGGKYTEVFYEDVLNGATVISSYLPATDGEAYQQGSEYFGGQKIYEELMNYSADVPRVPYGWYSYEARMASASCVQQIHSGMDIESALKEMEETLRFQMDQAG